MIFAALLPPGFLVSQAKAPPFPAEGPLNNCVVADCSKGAFPLTSASLLVGAPSFLLHLFLHRSGGCSFPLCVPSLPFPSLQDSATQTLDLEALSHMVCGCMWLFHSALSPGSLGSLSCLVSISSSLIDGKPLSHLSIFLILNFPFEDWSFSCFRCGPSGSISFGGEGPYSGHQGALPGDSQPIRH